MKQIYKNHMRNITLIYLVISVCMVLALYPLLPKILNYPPNSIDNAFQAELEGLTYTVQYILLIFVIVFLEMSVILIRSYKLSKYFTILDTAIPELFINVCGLKKITLSLL